MDPINLEFPSGPASTASVRQREPLSIMRISRVIRASMLAVAAVSAFTLPSSTEAEPVAMSNVRDVAALDASMIYPSVNTRKLGAASVEAEPPVAKKPKKKPVKKTTPAKKPKAKAKPTAKKSQAVKSPAAKKKAAAATNAAAPKKKKVKKSAAAPATKKAAKTPKKAKPTKKKTKKSTATKVAGAAAGAAAATATAEAALQDSASDVKDKKIKGNKNEGIIDGSSEGLAEIDKIDLRNEEGWVSVYDDPPLLVIKASLYAFIAYNDTDVCDTFNMTMNAVEQKAEENGRFSYHVVAYINCTKNGEDETQGRFILNFIPEGKRLLLTECGHREEGEIVNWLRIQEEVPECMTPSQRKKFLAQPMKHIHASNGVADTEAVQTDFLSRLEDFDKEEIAIVSSGVIVLIAVIVALVAFVLRKRKAQKDLERTIAGAKAEHAVEDDDLQIEPEEKATKERKGLMDSAKAKIDDADMEEGSFVNSPAVRV